MRRASEARWLLLVLGVLAALRVVYFLSYRDSLPFWDAPIADGQVYDDLARGVAHGDWLHPGLSYRPFLYPLWLGVVYSLAGEGGALPFVLQALFGLATTATVFFVGNRAWGLRAAICAAALCGLYAPLVASETKLLDSSLSLMLHTGSIAALLWASRPAHWIGAGALLGLASLARPPLWGFAALALCWLLLRRRRALVWVAAAAGLVLVGGSAWNYAASGNFTPLSRNGGITFLAGNNARARGDYGVPPGLTGEARTQEREQRRASRSGWSRGFEWIGAHPGAALQLVGLKLLRFAMADEAPLEHDLNAEREAIPILFAFAVPFSLLFVLGVTSLLLRRKEEEVLLLAGAVAVHLATALLFFVSSRYRLLAAPALALLGAAGLETIRERWSAGRKRWVAFFLLGCAAAAVALSFNPLDDGNRRAALAAFNTGHAWQRLGRRTEARAHLLRAVALNPSMAEAWLELGNLDARAEKTKRARAAYGRALALRPRYVRPLINLAIVALRAARPRPRLALSHLNKAMEIDPHHPTVWFQVGNARKAMGDLEGAESAFLRALTLRETDAAVWNNLGTTQWALGRGGGENKWSRFLAAARSLVTATLLGSREGFRNLSLLARSVGLGTGVAPR